MNKWEYRVLQDEQGDYGFVEVYYSNEDKIMSYSEFINPCGKNIKDLELDLEQMAEALNKPTLYWRDISKEDENA